MGDPLLEFASIQNLLNLAMPPAVAPEAPDMGVPYRPAAPLNLAPVPRTAGAAPAQAPPMVPLPDYSKAPTDVTVRGPKDLDMLRYLIRKTESGHNYQAKNPTTSASGAYQYINKTWGNYGGYAEARLAPRAVQDAKFNEDVMQKLKAFNGDPFRMIAHHMLPAQANNPAAWTRPSVIKVHGKFVHIPPVADYVRKVVRGSPWEASFGQYLKAHGAP